MGRKKQHVKAKKKKKRTESKLHHLAGLPKIIIKSAVSIFSIGPSYNSFLIRMPHL